MTKFYIDQHGCAKNQTDGELITGFLCEKGYVHTFNPDEADFILINSCGFIESAKKESIDAIYEVNQSYPNAKIILSGCLAERYAEELYESIPELAGVFGNGDIAKIAEFMKTIEKDGRAVKTFPQEGICQGKRPVLYNFKGSAFVKITEGCSNHCSFCAIPLIRGELRSRSVQDICNEIKQLVKDGIYEINLIGQDLAAFTINNEQLTITDNGEKSSALSVLLKEISKIEGNFIIRLLYIHPDHFNKDILDAVKSDARFLHYFDIPFQSGADSVIKRMNRTGSYKTYVKLVDDIRAVLPDVVLRTTFLTGFPGETEKDSEQTEVFLQTIEPDWSGCFPYSREDDTPAFTMKPRVPARTAQKRAQKLEELQTEITQNKLLAYVGKEFDVLVEEIIQLDEKIAEDASEGLALGRAWFQAPEVDGCVVIRYDRDEKNEVDEVKPGNVVRCKVISSTGVDLDSRFISLVKAFPEKSAREFL